MCYNGKNRARIMIPKRRSKRVKPSSFSFFPTHRPGNEESPFSVESEFGGKIRKISPIFGLNSWTKGDNLAVEIYSKLGQFTPYWREYEDGKTWWEKSPNSLVSQEISLTAYGLGETSGKKAIQVDLDKEYLAFRLDLNGKNNSFRRVRGQKSRKLDEAMLRVYQPSWLWLNPSEEDISQSHGDVKTLSTTKVNFRPANFRIRPFKGGKLLSFFDVNDKSRWHSGVFYHFWFPPGVVEGIEAMF
jgi:hypothetical protein